MLADVNQFKSAMQKNVTITFSLDEFKQAIRETLEVSPSSSTFNSEEDEMNQKDAAKFLGVSQTTIIKYKREGKIPYEQLPGSTKVKYYKSQLKKVISKNRHLLGPSRK
jgi:predicted DNA-binding protein (UPF0251 family)